LAPELLLGTGLFDRVHLSDRVAYLTALADMREDAPKRRLELRTVVVGDAAELLADARDVGGDVIERSALSSELLEQGVGVGD